MKRYLLYLGNVVVIKTRLLYIEEGEALIKNWKRLYGNNVRWEIE